MDLDKLQDMLDADGVHADDCHALIVTDAPCTCGTDAARAELCEGCGTPGSIYRGLCYECQCDAHMNGEINMDEDY